MRTLLKGGRQGSAASDPPALPLVYVDGFCFSCVAPGADAYVAQAAGVHDPPEWAGKEPVAFRSQWEPIAP